MNTVVVPRASPAHRALLRSEGSPLSGLPFTTLPLFPLQRASCSRAGVLGRWSLCGSRLPRGRRQSLSVLARPQPSHRFMDQRRIKVIAEGLPVFHGAQLAINATLVSPLRADGDPHRRGPDEDGAAQAFARRPRSAHTQSSQVAEVAPDWSSPRKRVAASRRRRRRCSDSWQKRRLAPPASSRPPVLVAPLGLPPVLCCCWGIRVFPVGSPRQPGR